MSIIISSQSDYAALFDPVNVHILALCYCGKGIMTFGGHAFLPPMAGCRCAICCFITDEL